MSTTGKSGSVIPFSTTNTKTFGNRFKNMIEMAPSTEILFERPYIDILMYGLTFSDPEISNLTVSIKTSYTGIGLSAPEMERKIKSLQTDRTAWEGRNLIGEENGNIYVEVRKQKTVISNFTLHPMHKITVDKGHMYFVYEVTVMNDNRRHRLMLRSEDFNKLENLQKAIAEQLISTAANINGCAAYMKDLLHKYINLAQWEFEKEGTSLIGLEVINNKKYFCAPDGIYGMNGEKSDELVYMGNEQSNHDEVKKLDNLGYNKKKWAKDIAPNFLKNIIHSNEKWAMMSLLGWMGAIPHDYVIRKEAGTGFFPHCHIIGEPGSGKSTVMTVLKQFMGHNDSAPRVFPTPFETSKLLNSSYTIPTVLDEYGKRWRPEQMDAMNKVLVEAFTKAPWSRGQSNLGSVYFKYKNPILMGGQIPTSDQALATRIVPVNIYKSFQNSPNGKKAYQHMQVLQKMPSKDFWAGYNIFCAQDSNEEVVTKYQHYREYCRGIIKENRVADIYAVVMLGLEYMLRLATELGVGHELGFTAEDILEMPNQLDQAAGATETKDVSPLTDFLRDLASYAISIGNSKIHGNYFGNGLAVMPHKPANSGAGHYGGRNNKQNACIYGRECLLIKIEDMVTVINNYKRGKSPHNAKEIMTFIESEFRKTLENPEDSSALVLAPKQYETQFGRYTAFHKDSLASRYSEFNNVNWTIR